MKKLKKILLSLFLIVSVLNLFYMGVENIVKKQGYGGLGEFLDKVYGVEAQIWGYFYLVAGVIATIYFCPRILAFLIKEIKSK